MPRKTEPTDTAQKILDIAQRLVQTRGFNAFSYADIAAALHITKASLHYHFASKAELGLKLIERYDRNFLDLLSAIDAEAAGAAHKIRRYVAIYASVLRGNRMCLCGMMAAEFATLPKSMRGALERFFEMNERWLAAVLDRGRADGELKFAGSTIEAAQFLLGALEGSMMLARSQGAAARFDAAAGRLLAEVGA